MDVSDIFYFFCSGEGKGESEAPGGRGGGRFFIENPKAGVVSQEGGEGQRGCLRGMGGGLKVFFSHQENYIHTKILNELFYVSMP